MPGLPLAVPVAFDSITMKLMRAVLLKVSNDFIMLPKGLLEGTYSILSHGRPNRWFKNSEKFQSNQPALSHV